MAIVLALSYAHPYRYAVAIVFAAAVLSMISRAGWKRGVAVAGIAVVVALLRMQLVPHEVPTAFLDLFGHKHTLEGTVVALPDVREASSRIVVELASGIERTRIIAAVPLYPEVHVGDKISVTGTVKHPEPFETDGGRTFAYDEFLRKDGIFGVMQPAQAVVRGESGSLWLRFLRQLERLKSVLISLLNRALPDPENSLAVGILVGGKQGLGTKLLDDFSRAGMLQIVVLSGYNVMIVANTLMRLIGRLPSTARLLVGGASILCFVLIAGAGSSALRAGLMAFFAIAARTFGRTYDVLPAVFASILALGLWNPLLLAFDPGFQFSFIATVGLILGTPVVTPMLRTLRNGTLIELVSTTLAAEIALLPFLLWQTGQLSVVSVAANVAAMPAIPAAMAASTLAIAAAFVLAHVHPVLPLIAGLPAYLPLAYVIEVATLCASLPFATFTIAAFPFWVVLASYAALALAYVRLTRRLRPADDFPPRPSSGSPGRPRHTSSSGPAYSQS
jgi:competence protein ComEC